MVSACLHRLDRRVEVLPEVRHDRGYASAYHRSTRTSRVYRGIEHQFSVNATHLSSAFLHAFRTRHRLLAGAHSDILARSSRAHQTAFLVSLAAPQRVDLRDYLLWTVRLRDGDSSSEPVAITKIHNKDKLELFFDHVTPWSSEYLLVFDAPPYRRAAPLQLVLGNSRARVQLSWAK